MVRENGMLIAGHGRLEAAKLEGITEVPTIVARGWTEVQCRAYSPLKTVWWREAVNLFLHGVDHCAHDCRHDGARGAAPDQLADDGGDVETTRTARERGDKRAEDRASPSTADGACKRIAERAEVEVL